jgi:hypothetical protein
MKFELVSYKSGRSKEALMKTEVTVEELEYLYGLVDRELIMSDALYGIAGGTRKERSLMQKTHMKLNKMIQYRKTPMSKESTLACSTTEIEAQ